MSPGRMMSVLGGVVLATGVAAAQPAKAPAPAPAPAPGGTPAAVPAAGSAEGAAVAPIEEAPPSDMEGRDENPDAPRTGEEPAGPTGPAPAMKKSGYPIEESQRPITLPANMGEVSIAPHFQVSPYVGGDALRFRYGITPKVQLGLTYVFAGAYDDPGDMKDKVALHAGKAAGLDVTVLLQNWIAVKVGIPVYLDPFAMSFAAGAPMKFIISDKVAVGGMDDVLNIRIQEFPVSLYQEQLNALGAANKMTGSEQSRGRLRFSGFAEYQQSQKMTLIGRIGLDRDLGGGGGGAAGTSSVNETQTFIRAGFQYSPKKFLDVGVNLGFDNLATAGSFGGAGFLAVRI